MQRKRRSRGSGGVRIIGGAWRGRRLPIPTGTSVRPTPDRVRETLFNWLAADLPGARCVDLFSGSGALGLEALSRGAEEAWLIERDPVLARALEERVVALDARARVICADALGAIRRPPEEPFDLAFVDPPYEMDLVAILRGLNAWLTRDNLVYVERPARPRESPLRGLEIQVSGARVTRQSRAGGVAYGLMRLTI